MKQKLQWVEIEKSALVLNIGHFRRLVGDEKNLLAVVKANAYGHGILPVSRIALDAGVNWLGVHSLEEGVLLQEAGFACPILILGYVASSDLKEAVIRGLRLTVYNRETVELLGKICQRLKRNAFIHLKLETGTYRQGIEAQDLFRFLQDIQKHRCLLAEGLSSHFANIEDTTDHSYPQHQLQVFLDTAMKLRKKGVDIPVKHMACTAATILFPETYFDMVRVGIGLYGLWPSKETYLSCLLREREPLELKPVLSWKARIAQVKRVPKGSFIGYGCTYRTTRDTLLAVIPVGYYDGYSRGLSNSAYVLVRGKRAALRGRVAMDFIVADITDIPGVELEDEVTLIGRDGQEYIGADTLASLTGTIGYEVVTRINPSIPRIVT